VPVEGEVLREEWDVGQCLLVREVFQILGRRIDSDVERERFAVVSITKKVSQS
jgi:hypothetical protein